MELHTTFHVLLALVPMSMAKQWEDRERKKQQGSSPPSCDWREISSSIIGWNICGPPASAAVASRGPSPSSSNMNWRALLNFSHLHWCQLLDLLLDQAREHWRTEMVNSPSVEWCFRSWSSSTYLLLFTFQGSQKTAASMVSGIRWERRFECAYPILCRTKIPPIGWV